MKAHKNSLSLSLVGIAALVVLPLTSHAATIVLVNNDFEDGNLGSFTNTGSTNATNVADSGFQGSGTRAAFFTNNSSTLTLTSTLNFATVDATSFTVSFN